MKSGKMSRSEAGRIGAQKTKEVMVGIMARRRADYAANPTRCLKCRMPLPYERRGGKFCTHSHAVAFNNEKRKSKPRSCASCGGPTHNPKFCSNKCQREGDYKKLVEAWLNGEDDGIRSDGLATAAFIKRWVVERSGGCCSICGGEQWQGQPMPLVLDHINGNGKDNSPENLRVVCGNCDMLLPTFAGRNRGSGRLARKKWDDKLAAEMSVGCAP